MKNNKGRGGGALLFSSTEKGGILEGGVLFERGGGGGGLIEDLRYLDLSSCQYDIPSSPNRSLPSPQSSRLFLTLACLFFGNFYDYDDI